MTYAANKRLDFGFLRQAKGKRLLLNLKDCDRCLKYIYSSIKKGFRP